MVIDVIYIFYAASTMSDFSLGMSAEEYSPTINNEMVRPYNSTSQSAAPTTTPEPGQNMGYNIPEAWINNQQHSQEAQVQFPEVNNIAGQTPGKETGMSLMQEMLKYDANLNIKGIGTICKISWKEV